MIKIYTDGSCLSNPGKGGWAGIILINNKKIEISGAKKDTTNNQMELLAPIKALKKIPKVKVKLLRSYSISNTYFKFLFPYNIKNSNYQKLLWKSKSI